MSSRRIINSMDNKHLYILIGGTIASCLIVPDLMSAYKSRKIEKERVQMKANIKQLQSDVKSIQEIIKK